MHFKNLICVHFYNVKTTQALLTANPVGRASATGTVGHVISCVRILATTLETSSSLSGALKIGLAGPMSVYYDWVRI